MREEILTDSGALRRGHFLLSSGRHADTYIQCALLLESPARARQIGGELADELRSLAPDSVLSPALGGLIIGHEVAAALGVPFRFTERSSDGGTEMALRRGFTLRPGERVVIVEDVITTGKSTLETVAVATALGAEVVGVGAIIDRTGDVHPFEIPFRNLVRLDLASWNPADCPLCAAGEPPAQKPGSRPT